MVWCCQPVAAAICSTVAPSGRLSSSIMQGLLGAGARRGLLGRRSLGSAWPPSPWPFAWPAWPRCRPRSPGPAASVAWAPASADVAPVSAGVAPSGASSSVSTPMAGEAGAGDPERRRVVAARGALVIDQALGLEAAEDLVDGAALDLERLGQRQDRTVVALGGGAEDDGLGVAELGHGMISICRRALIALLRAPSPGGRSRSGRGREIGRGYAACSPSLKAHVGDPA